MDKSITALAITRTRGARGHRHRGGALKPLLLISLLSACGETAPPAAESKAEAVAQAGEPSRISISERIAKDAGLRVAQVEMATLPATVELIGEVAADPDRMAKVPVRVAGRLVELRFHEGQRVAAGDVLAVIELAARSSVRSRRS